MAGAPAYRYDNYDYDYAQAQPRTNSRPDIYVIPGRGPAAKIDPRVFVALRVLVAMVLILMIAFVARIQLVNAAVAESITYDELAMDVNTARATGSALEVQASNLSNPAYVRDYAAKKLGMAAPTTVETIALGEDVVVVDEGGALSLSGSLAAVARK